MYNGDKHDLGTAPLRCATILVDQDDQVRFAIGLNDAMQTGSELEASARPPMDGIRAAGFRDESIEPQRFSGDNQSVLFTGVREGESLPALYRLDLQTRDVEKVHAFDNAEVTGVITDFADREVVGVRGYGDQPLIPLAGGG